MLPTPHTGGNKINTVRWFRNSGYAGTAANPRDQYVCETPLSIVVLMKIPQTCFTAVSIETGYSPIPNDTQTFFKRNLVSRSFLICTAHSLYHFARSKYVVPWYAKTMKFCVSTRIVDVSYPYGDSPNIVWRVSDTLQWWNNKQRNTFLSVALYLTKMVAWVWP